MPVQLLQAVALGSPSGQPDAWSKRRRSTKEQAAASSPSDDTAAHSSDQQVQAGPQEGPTSGQASRALWPGTRGLAGEQPAAAALMFEDEGCLASAAIAATDADDEISAQQQQQVGWEGPDTGREPDQPSPLDNVQQPKSHVGARGAVKAPLQPAAGRAQRPATKLSPSQPPLVLAAEGTDCNVGGPPRKPALPAEARGRKPAGGASVARSAAATAKPSQTTKAPSRQPATQPRSGRESAAVPARPAERAPAHHPKSKRQGPAAAKKQGSAAQAAAPLPLPLRSADGEPAFLVAALPAVALPSSPSPGGGQHVYSQIYNCMQLLSPRGPASPRLHQLGPWQSPGQVRDQHPAAEFEALRAGLAAVEARQHSARPAAELAQAAEEAQDEAAAANPYAKFQEHFVRWQQQR